MKRALFSVTATLVLLGILMMFSSPLNASQIHSSTLETQLGAKEHHVQFLSTSESNLKPKGEITLIEPEPKQAQSSENKQQEEQEIQQVSETSQEGETMYVKATAYTAYCDGCSGTTRTGIDLRANPDRKVIAVDPNVIPLGSKVWVEGYGTAIAGDTGSAIKGNRIDIFMPNEADALRFGVRQVRIRVIE
ncbi:3D domain-containing protein [Aquisalibacillus elongatus]|uniref:3D domain-containing protein n=1 Tax=Aquisalibacillus elongatus TaxID=485577 RepID=UPI000F52431F